MTDEGADKPNSQAAAERSRITCVLSEPHLRAISEAKRLVFAPALLRVRQAQCAT